MKGFFAIFLVVCGLFAAAWFFYDPFLRPLFARLSSGSSMTDENKVVTGTKEKSAPTPPVSVAPTPAKTAEPSGATRAPQQASAPLAKPKTELEELLEARYPMPEILPILAIVDQWRNVPPNAYPAEVAAKESVPFELVINGQVAGSSNVAPGTPFKPVRLTGDILTIASLANPAMSTQIQVDKTDFKERIEARYTQFVESKRREVEEKREKVKDLVLKDPARIALLRGESLPSPDSSDDSRFGIVKESLRRGDVSSVRLSEAVSFRWNGTETVAGDYPGTYETVTVAFKVSTIFGTFPVEYKCLLKGGRVAGWIDAVTEDRVS